MRTILIAILTFLLGLQIGHKDVEFKWANYKPTVSVTNRDVPKNIGVDFKLFWDTWDLLSKTYIDKKVLDPSKLFYGSIQGMVAAVGDPYTVFLPPEQQKSTKEELNGSFEGVGIQLGFNEESNSSNGNEDKPPSAGSKEKRLVVVAPLSGTPASKAGIKPKDLIVKIDDKDTNGMSLPEAVKLIRGLKGTKVSLTIFRDGDTDTKTYTLVRDTIIVKSVEVSFKSTKGGKEVGVIKLSRFGDKTKDEWNQVVSEIVSKNPAGLVLDVRNNPGGYLEGAVYILSEFLDVGDVAVMQENSDKERLPFKVSREGRLKNLPMIVLINKGSASASEIVAGALQDKKIAKLVGEKSFGKGTIQEAQELSQGTGIHITVAKWLTPNGRWVNDSGGFDPDVKIDMDEQSSSASKEDPAARPSDGSKDPQMDKAFELLDQ